MTSALSRALVWLPTALVAFAAMDLWAAMLHGRVWHRILWTIHRSHHTPRRGRFEANDALSILHAPIALGLILYGCTSAPTLLREVAYGGGIGMTLFGISYVVVHDGLVHRRLPVSALLRVPYLRAVVRAHRVHHAGLVGGPPFGFFFGPWELERARGIRRTRRATERGRGPTGQRSGARARG